MTARQDYRTGLNGQVINWYDETGLPLELPTLADYFNTVGYRSHAVGKWHLGHQDQAYWPTRRGFQSFYGHLLGQIDYFEHTYDGAKDWWRNETPLVEEGYATRLLGAEAAKVIAREATVPGPFFLYLAFNAPHAPEQAPQETVDSYSYLPEPRRTQVAMLAEMDQQIKGVLEALDQSGEANETLVIFFSDNGAPHNGKTGGSNLPWRGGKGSLYEGGIRTAAAARFPGQIGASSHVTTPVRVVDIARSLIGLTGADTLGQTLDGRDLGLRLFEDAQTTDPLLVFLGDRGYAQAVQGDLTYVRQAGVGELFDLKLDPAQTTDLSGEQPGVTMALSDFVDQHDIPQALFEPPLMFKVPIVGRVRVLNVLYRPGDPVGSPATLNWPVLLPLALGFLALALTACWVWRRFR